MDDDESEDELGIYLQEYGDQPELDPDPEASWFEPELSEDEGNDGHGSTPVFEELKSL